jgi:hypothetical protein
MTLFLIVIVFIAFTVVAILTSRDVYPGLYTKRNRFERN